MSILLIVFVLVFLLFFWRSFPGAYHVRMALHVFLAWREPMAKDWREETIQEFRCWPDDLDWNLHMNNSSYGKIADYGRYSHFLKFFRKNVAGANGGVTMRYKVTID